MKFNRAGLRFLLSGFPFSENKLLKVLIVLEPEMSGLTNARIKLNIFPLVPCSLSPARAKIMAQDSRKYFRPQRARRLS